MGNNEIDLGLGLLISSIVTAYRVVWLEEEQMLLDGMILSNVHFIMDGSLFMDSNIRL